MQKERKNESAVINIAGEIWRGRPIADLINDADNGVIKGGEGNK